MTDDIQTMNELLHAPYNDIHLADVKLKQARPTERLRGRVVDRWNNQDLTLRKDDHEYTVSGASEWTLESCTVVSSTYERNLIAHGWDDE